MAPRSRSVRLARVTRGSLNCGTPLAIASTPVSALHPAEKALSTSRIPTASTACAGTREWPGCGTPSAKGWISPTAITARRPTMNRSVGRRKARALSPSPRRLRTVMSARMPRQMGTVAEDSDGKADTSEATPAEIDTATVNT